MPYISHEKLIEDNKPDYYLTLRKSQKTFKTDHEDISPWLDFFLIIFLKQSERAVDLLSKENIEKLLSKNQMAVWQYLQVVEEAAPSEIAKNAKVLAESLGTVSETHLVLLSLTDWGYGLGYQAQHMVRDSSRGPNRQASVGIGPNKLLA